MIIGTVLISIGFLDQNPGTTVKGRISEDYLLYSENVYLFAIDGNEYFLVDSAIINPESRCFNLYGNIPRTDLVGFLVIPPREYGLLLWKGDELSIDITPQTRYAYPHTSGSEIMKMEALNVDYAIELRKRIEEVESIINKGGIQEEEKARYQADLDEVKYEFYTGRYFKNMESTLSPSSFRTSLRYLTGEVDGTVRIDTNTYDSLVVFMKAKFPDDTLTQQFPDIPEPSPISEESKRVMRLKSRLMGNDIPETTHVYKTGDIVRPFEVPSPDGTMLSIADIDTEYILVDFWAGWCAPCRKEIPAIKETVSRHGDRLTVYAISLDNNEQQWQTAIQQDGSEIFTHIFLGATPEKNEIMRRFGVGSIPANFLLDSDRRIIATDLRGEQLAEKMQELTQ